MVAEVILPLCTLVMTKFNVELLQNRLEKVVVNPVETFTAELPFCLNQVKELFLVLASNPGPNIPKRVVKGIKLVSRRVFVLWSPHDLRFLKDLGRMLVAKHLVEEVLPAEAPIRVRATAFRQLSDLFQSHWLQVLAQSGIKIILAEQVKTTLDLLHVKVLVSRSLLVEHVLSKFDVKLLCSVLKEIAIGEALESLLVMGLELQEVLAKVGTVSVVAQILTEVCVVNQSWVRR